MFGLGFGELVLIFLIALIFIGPKKLPELAKGLGQGIRDFQNAAKGLSDQIQNDTAPTETKKVADAVQQAPSEEQLVAPSESENSDKGSHS